MLWKTIVIVTILGAPTMQVVDTEKVGYPTMEECYYRGAKMIFSIMQRSPVIMGHTFCIEVENLKDKDEDKNKDEDEKASPEGKII